MPPYSPPAYNPPLTAKDKLYKLTMYGYFPKELPPFFTTKPFADLIAGKTIENASKEISRGTKFYIPKSQHFKRLITVTNPIHQYLLSKQIADNYNIIQNIFDLSKNSYSIPKFSNSEQRAIGSTKGYNDYRRDRVIKSCGFKYILTTDISRYYYSIYTHSIPWAFDTKEVAKKQKNNRQLTSNEIDRLLRNMQDQQTLGIPVGPDTSKIISEILLCDIDYMFLDKFPDMSYLRYVDDFTIPCESLGKAKEILNELVRIFNHYELDLNESKTEILTLPVGLESDWITILKHKPIRSNPNEQELDIIAYFNLAFDLYKKYPTEKILHYTLVEKLAVKIHEQNWHLFESLILQCTLYDASIFPLVGKILYTYKKLGYNLNEKLIHNSLLLDYKDKISNYNSFELIWAIYILCQLEIHINIDESEVLKSKDVLFITTLLYANEKGRYKGKIPKNNWQSYMIDDSLFSDSWLLAFESNNYGWLKNRKGKDICASDPFFDQLKRENISFLDFDANIKEIDSKYFDSESSFDLSDILYGN